MSNKSERNLVNILEMTLERTNVLTALLIISSLALLYFLLGLLWQPPDGSLQAIIKSLFQAVIVGLIPVFIIFAGSYAVRSLQRAQREREKSDLVSRIISELRSQNEQERLDLAAKIAAEIRATSQLTSSQSSQQYTDMAVLRQGMELIMRKLGQKGFHPDIIISFNRSGTAFAGMLADNWQILHLVSITRRPIEKPRLPTEKKEYVVGEFIHLNVEKLKGKKILILFMLMETTQTLDSGLKYLRSEGMSEDLIRKAEIATMYITPGALNLKKTTIYAYETNDPKGVLERLPWIIEKFDFI